MYNVYIYIYMYNVYIYIYICIMYIYISGDNTDQNGGWYPILGA